MGLRRAPVHSSIAFDLTVTSLFVPLLLGAEVVVAPDGLGVEPLVAMLQDIEHCQDSSGWSGTGWSDWRQSPGARDSIRALIPLRWCLSR